MSLIPENRINDEERRRRSDGEAAELRRLAIDRAIRNQRAAQEVKQQYTVESIEPAQRQSFFSVPTVKQEYQTNPPPFSVPTTKPEQPANRAFFSIPTAKPEQQASAAASTAAETPEEQASAAALRETVQNTNDILASYDQQVDNTIKTYQHRESTLANRKLKVVGATGGNYKVVLPDWEKFEQQVTTYQQQGRAESPTMVYKLGPKINMNKAQRAQQQLGQLPGCIANCNVKPVGQGRKLLLSNSDEENYPEPNQIIYGMYQQLRQRTA